MLYENIRELCQKKGASIPQVEKALGFGAGTIYKWKKSSPKIENLKRVADFFGVTVDELLKEKGAANAEG
jgi:transcriptional regulator with XRE-family HTH domain